MPLTLNGSGTVSGISAGGLPDGIIQSADLASGVGGKILQVKQVVKTDSYSFVSSSNDERLDITGLTIDITPVSASSKILVEYRVNVGGPNGAYRILVHLMRGSSDIYKGDQDSGQTNQTRCSNHINTMNDGVGASRTALTTGQFLDSPNTTSAITYKLQIHTANSGNTYYVNRSAYTSNHNYVGREPSHITVQEIAA